ncbi:MAG: hypothetical protein WBF08_08775 [Candidatus Bathyarchaeia archaeon]
MTTRELAFISFEQTDKKYKGFLAMEAALNNDREPEYLIQKAIEIYENSINDMTSHIDEINKCRNSRKHVSARQIWQVGDEIFKLKDDLENLGLQLDGVYDHLTRDLKVKQKWLEKVIILRRYLPEIGLIPETLNWGKLEKGTRRKTERLKLGLPPV